MALCLTTRAGDVKFDYLFFIFFNDKFNMKMLKMTELSQFTNKTVLALACSYEWEKKWTVQQRQRECYSFLSNKMSYTNCCHILPWIPDHWTISTDRHKFLRAPLCWQILFAQANLARPKRRSHQSLLTYRHLIKPIFLKQRKMGQICHG